MALDTNGLLALIANTLPDNITGLNSSADVRLVMSEMVDSSKITLDPAPPETPNNRKYINSSADFDAIVLPSGGVYNLPGNTEYYIGAGVSVDNRPVLSAGNISISGDSSSSSLTYTGTGDMITGVDVGRCRIEGVTLSQPNASAGDAIYNFSDSGSAFSVVNLGGSAVTKCDTFGKVQNILGLTADVINLPDIKNGLSIIGTGMSLLSISRIGFFTTNSSFVAVDLGSNVFSALEIGNLFVNAVSGSAGIKGLANSGNVASGVVASVSDCEFLGGMTPLDTITEDDFRFKFEGNSGITDTNPDGLLSLAANATATTITTAGVPVKIAGVWTVRGSSHFVGDTTGRLTYVGERPITLPIDIRATIEPVSGTNKNLRVCVAINGTHEDHSCAPYRADSGNPVSVTPIWQHKFLNGDYLEGFVENGTDTVDVLVSSAVSRIR